MFPFQSGELSFQVSNNNLEDSNFLYNQLEQNVSVPTTTTTNLLENPQHGLNPCLKSSKTRKSRSEKSIQDNNNNGDEINGNDNANKKVIHREVERQRRQEMSNLYSSLRSLLPMEYVRVNSSSLNLFFFFWEGEGCAFFFQSKG